MLAILITHTLVLSIWLAEEETNQKQANFKVDEHNSESSNNELITDESFNKDSLKTVAPTFTTNTSSRLK